jgi:hypothetical protein
MSDVSIAEPVTIITGNVRIKRLPSIVIQMGRHEKSKPIDLLGMFGQHMVDNDAFSATLQTVAEWQCIERKMSIELTAKNTAKVMVQVDAAISEITILNPDLANDVLPIDFTAGVADGNIYSGQLVIEFVK